MYNPSPAASSRAGWLVVGYLTRGQAPANGILRTRKVGQAKRLRNEALLTGRYLLPSSTLVVLLGLKSPPGVSKKFNMILHPYRTKYRLRYWTVTTKQCAILRMDNISRNIPRINPHFLHATMARNTTVICPSGEEADMNLMKLGRS